MFTLRIWVFKSGILTNLFILSKHGTKANIGSTKMANNRHAYNRDVLQSYWTSDGLPLYCSQPTGEKTHTNQSRTQTTLAAQQTSVNKNSQKPSEKNISGGNCMGYERMHSYRNRPFWNLHIGGLNTILCFISSVLNLLSDPLIVYFVLCN